jgi:hypothetical protein
VTTDIVIDTNVFVHAHNAAIPEHADALLFCNLVRNHTVTICLDEGFSLIESDNRSQIGEEYLEHLRAGSVGLALVAHLASTGRMRFVAALITPPDRRWLRKQIPRNGVDRTYVIVALNTEDRVLVSHDRTDFTPNVRASLLNRLDVNVIFADAAQAIL